MKDLETESPLKNPSCPDPARTSLRSTLKSLQRKGQGMNKPVNIDEKKENRDWLKGAK